MISKLTRLLDHEKLSYLFFGVLTTAVNYISYFVCGRILLFDYRIATIIAWVLAVAFAFFTNKFFVFKSTSMEPRKLLREAATFTAARLVSGLFDVGWMIFAVEWLKMNDLIAKVLANVVVIILNYFFSKLFVFRKS